jgi:hypothetical protein
MMEDRNMDKHPRNGAPCMDPDHDHIDRRDARACGCPHDWPSDIYEQDGDHYCSLCGADGLA